MMDRRLRCAFLPLVMLGLAATIVQASPLSASGDQRGRLAQFALAQHAPDKALFWLSSGQRSGERYLRALAWLQVGRQSDARAELESIAASGQSHRGDAALALVKLGLDNDDTALATRFIDQAVALSGGAGKQEALYYQAELYRQGEHVEQAGKVLSRMDAGYWAALGYLNLAADYSRMDRDPSRALVSLRVAQAMAASDGDAARARDLGNRILLRAGFLSFKRGDYDKALSFLEKVTLDSYLAPQALYFDGLAHAAKKNYRAAMQAWHRARKYSLAFPGAADAWLGMGSGYDESGYLGQAGEAYLAASSAFESEQVSINSLLRNIRKVGAYEALVKAARRDDVEWFLADSRTLAQPRMAYLLHFLEQSDAQSSVNRVAGLDSLADSLTQKLQDLDVFLGALKQHQNRSGNALKSRQDSIGIRLTALSERVVTLSRSTTEGTVQARQLQSTNATLAELKRRKAQFGQRQSQSAAHSAALYQRAKTARASVLHQQQRLTKLRARAEAALNVLALDFLARQSQQITDRLDRTEQQIAHLYEHLALTGLDQGVKQ